MAQTRRHHLPHSGQRSNRILFDTDADQRRRLQRNCQCDDLIVVEQQGWQLAAGVESVSAVRAHGRRNAVTHLPEPVDVAADSAMADVEPLGE